MGLLLRMMKSYFSTDRYVILDYGFCFLKGLIQLSKKGVFACGVIKNIRCWPAMVPGKEMENHFWEVEVGVGGTYDIQRRVDGFIYNYGG